MTTSVATARETGGCAEEEVETEVVVPVGVPAGAVVVGAARAAIEANDSRVVASAKPRKEVGAEEAEAGVDT